MSKSAGEKHYINVFADEARIRKQVRSAVTDTGEPTDEMSPGIQNLFTLIKASGFIDDHDSLINDYHAGSLKYVALKEAAANALVSLSSQFIENKKAIIADKREVKYKIKQSSENIRKTAQQTVKDVKELSGLLNVKL